MVDAGNGTGDGATRISNYVTKLMAQMPEMLKDVSGVDMNQMLQGIMKQAKDAPKDAPAE